jgi:hypothetical protein
LFPRLTLQTCGVKKDPTAKIQWSVVMLFFAMCALVLRLTVCRRRRSSTPLPLPLPLPLPVAVDGARSEEASEAFLSATAPGVGSGQESLEAAAPH